MALTPEGRVKEKVKRVLKATNVWYFMPVSNGMGKMGIPDFVCCFNGKFFTVETKAPGKKPTKLQDMQMTQIGSAGGKAFVIDGDTQELEAWLTTP
jgi:hypothetical protein